jgi:hypothetical protein
MTSRGIFPGGCRCGAVRYDVATDGEAVVDGLPRYKQAPPYDL